MVGADVSGHVVRVLSSRAVESGIGAGVREPHYKWNTPLLAVEHSGLVQLLEEAKASAKACRELVVQVETTLLGPSPASEVRDSGNCVMANSEFLSKSLSDIRDRLERLVEELTAAGSG